MCDCVCVETYYTHMYIYNINYICFVSPVLLKVWFFFWGLWCLLLVLSDLEIWLWIKTHWPPGVNRFDSSPLELCFFCLVQTLTNGVTRVCVCKWLCCSQKNTNGTTNPDTFLDIGLLLGGKWWEWSSWGIPTSSTWSTTMPAIVIRGLSVNQRDAICITGKQLRAGHLMISPNLKAWTHGTKCLEGWWDDGIDLFASAPQSTSEKDLTCERYVWMRHVWWLALHFVHVHRYICTPLVLNNTCK